MATTTGTQTSGWVVFATVMLLLAAVFDVLFGLAMIANSDWVVLTEDGAWLVDLTVWGWITLLVGVVLGFAAYGVSTGQTWAKIVAIIAAGLAAIDALFTIPIYPLWGIVIMALSIFVIYGLAVHGDEVETA